MSREIKFRAWDKKRSEMLSNDQIEETLPIKVFNDSRYLIMQYTGLKDKNGKEIYEGDIIGGYKIVPGVVEWQEWLEDIEVSMAGFSFPYVHSKNNMVVLGNIYENAELLNEA